MSMTREQQAEIKFEEKKTLRRRVMDYAEITIASLLYSAAVSLFLDPNALAPGGVTGIAIILNRITGLETGTLVLCINIPIIAVGTWKFGWRFILSTMYCTALTSGLINLLAPLGPATTDPFLAAVAGGALMAVGIGLVFKAGATTGGTDIIIKLLRLRFPHLKTGVLFLITDALIVALSALVFKNLDVALYAGLVVFINSVLLDVVLYGRDGAKLIFIISDRHEAITKRLLEELDIGVTYISGSGAYSGREKKVIMCVMKKQISPRAEIIVREEDPGAFMIVAGATEIFGEGYKSIYSEKL
ncbi:MAG: YitT family protein [Butyrivibrio sp.]|nr:YitT family protein [Acetatifactor muris]MCM1558500.1 YitT family protein [Butyrivibrio sp.]